MNFPVFRAPISGVNLDQVQESVVTALEGLGPDIQRVREEITITFKPECYLEGMKKLKQAPGCQFEQLMDLCGVDYSTYKDGMWEGPRFAVVSHLLSVSLNQRVRVRVFCPDDAFPMLPSLVNIWNGANWYEREAFDLYGILFEGHPDLRRILTDYGFVGHPFRKDFPLSGHVEMRYDPDRQRVIYEPVTIEPREITPRILREANYGRLPGAKIH